MITFMRQKEDCIEIHFNLLVQKTCSLASMLLLQNAATFRQQLRSQLYGENGAVII